MRKVNFCWYPIWSPPKEDSSKDPLWGTSGQDSPLPPVPPEEPFPTRVYFCSMFWGIKPPEEWYVLTPDPAVTFERLEVKGLRSFPAHLTGPHC